MRFNVSETKKILKEKLGSLYNRAETIFLINFGEGILFDVANILMHAADQGEEKVKEVLDLLQNHFHDHLVYKCPDPEYQHPDMRGTPYSFFGTSKTEVMFSDIFEKILGLEPMKEQEILNEPLIVKTRNSIYRFGRDERGKRVISRDKKPLDFSYCKITKLVIGDEMVIERLDNSGLGYRTTTAVLSIEAL